ncbi:MAG: flagellum-specific ATP synthase [Candidatus Midichloriaceae bacterium]|jgi:flagellum-specific ATP synthase
MSNILRSIISEVNAIPEYQVIGKIRSIKGLLIEVVGIEFAVCIGSRCKIVLNTGAEVYSEVVGVNNDVASLMTFDSVEGIGIGCLVHVISHDQSVHPSDAWLGRVVDAFGNPIDEKGPIINGTIPYKIHAAPPKAHLRRRVKNKMDTGIRALNSFLSCCYGQRMGIFSGSGVGKSIMLSMLTKYSSSDVKIIGLIGERGREVQEFLQDYLGEEGLRKAIVVVATSDESALKRKQAAYLTMTLCDYFREQGKNVLCMLDSVTRFAMAQREIGLAIGEPPTTKGYTPSVFSELPKLLERAGPGMKNEGDVTGFFSVLVEGDDHNEPISDAVRGILDGHVVLSRKIANRGIYPAIDVLQSVSRTMPKCNNDYENALVEKAKSLIAQFTDMEDMIRIGAYKKGSDPLVDEAIKYIDNINAFISQNYDQNNNIEESYAKLAKAIDFGKNKEEKLQK